MDGDTGRAAAMLTDAIALWRGDPLPDLHGMRDPGIEAEVSRFHLLALSELRLVADDAAESFALAERALSLEPFDAHATASSSPPPAGLPVN